MSLKIAVSGKGGVGKTTVAAVLASLYAREGKKVIAVDADPASSLPAALGVPEQQRKEIVPLSQMLDLIEERTGARPGETPSFFSLNPRVDDLVERFAVRGEEDIDILVLGTIQATGSGCFCPESALLKGLLRHLILDDKHVVVIDLEAGLEHLGRSTSKAVDVMLIVVEPGRRSVETAERIGTMANTLGIKNIFIIINKVSTSQQEVEVTTLLMGSPWTVLGFIPYVPEMIDADLNGRSALDCDCPRAVEAIQKIKENIDLSLR